MKLTCVVPLEQVVLETDSPYMLSRCLKDCAPHSRRNEPANVAFLLDAVAEIRQAWGQTRDEVKALVDRNTRILFGLSWL